MHQVLVIGAGNIGSLITARLAYSDDYFVYLVDNHLEHSSIQKINPLPNCILMNFDARDTKSLEKFLKQTPVDAIISCLPFYCTMQIAALAAQFNLHYFDLTEDVKTSNAIQALAISGKAFIPQCGLAPGLVNIVANDLMQHFTILDTVKLRVGALPINISNALQYALTWSTDGLINEYGNMCEAIENGKPVGLLPLDDIEEIKIDGLTYEAFNTSGGIGSLIQTYTGKVKNLNYKTIRYPGHGVKMRFLMNELKLNEDRDTLKRLLENAIPKTYQDVVLVYISITGIQDNQFKEENFLRKFYPKKMHGFDWSAIQMTTASSTCAVVDLVLTHPEKYYGYLKQETFSLSELVQNRFGNYFG